MGAPDDIDIVDLFLTLPKDGVIEVSSPHPSAEELGVRVVPWPEMTDENRETVLAALMRLRSIENTDHPLHVLHVIEAFALCIKVGLYPPARLLERVADAFGRWHAAQGSMTMDEALGIAAGRGKAPVFTAAARSARDELAMLTVARLRHLGASVDDAVRAIVALHARRQWNNSGQSIGPLSERQMKRLWESKRTAVYRSALYKKKMLDAWASNQPAVAEFLQQFPVLPPALEALRAGTP